VAAGAAAAAPSGLAVADIVLLGSVPRGRALLRSGARPGDRIYVTGALGGAAAELLALERNPAKFARMAKAVSGHPHLYPIPRLAVASRLASSRSVHAAIDLSDGLSTDLAEIHSTAVPIHPLASQAEEHRRASSALDLALHGGEDYELLFTAPKSAKVPRSIGGVKLSHIGEILKPKAGRPLVSFVRKDGTSGELKAAGWEHFQPSQ
jgi:thiamine-monophosphate kinase